MATTLEVLAKYLNVRGWKYRVDAAKSRIITGVKAENVEDFVISIQLSENGEFLQLIAPQLLSVKNHVYKGIVFQTLLSITWEHKMLRFEYDRTDGEVRASIELPLEDAILTERQFNRALEGLIDLVDRITMPRVQAVLATGVDPGNKNLEENLLDALPDELLSMLEQAIIKRQQRDR
ncbi:hypothetical protein Cri9333_0594 [Crinalium epipsammum PCC 9333]|uniref:YbjN domain-containing protein n=1 Tax=Crinalium epipsammum PCC 9333 TaxID=1173022 RepID=K9VWN2_9CYAN|nr:hypothetical protein [Crinalium epipsammum]AFZ11540.1 hypothetical protein Cri9333_0594 [Crinalium epipsammum PCC 9333]